MAEFLYEDMLPIGEDDTPWRLVTTEGIETVEGPDGVTFLKVAPETLEKLAETAMHDIAYFLRPAHLGQLRKIMDDPEASENDKFVALDLLKNANISSGGIRRCHHRHRHHHGQAWPARAHRGTDRNR